jgi:hypothetical protein
MHRPSYLFNPKFIQPKRWHPPHPPLIDPKTIRSKNDSSEARFPPAIWLDLDH